MIWKIPARERFHAENGWLSAYWLFSFDQYYDPRNVSFGALRVFNHDTVQPGAGFPTHGHREMEIVTYVLEGALEHKDSTGGHGIIHAGEVQRMTAGTGVRHSEFNASDSEPVKLLQMWVLPAESGLAPSYEQRQFAPAERGGKLLPIASGQDAPNAVKVHQDVTFYVSNVRVGDEVRHEIKSGRRAFLYVFKGGVSVNGVGLSEGDQARITDEAELRLTSTEQGEVMLIDLP